MTLDLEESVELGESSPSGVVPGGVGMLTTAGVRYGWSQFRGSVSLSLAFRLERLGKGRPQVKAVTTLNQGSARLLLHLVVSIVEANGPEASAFLYDMQGNMSYSGFGG